MASELRVTTIASNAGTAALTIDSSGRVATPARPAFMVYKTGTQSGVSGHLSFNNTEFDIGSDWNTNYFLAPIAGVYHFGWNCFVANSNGGLRSGSNSTVCMIEKSTDNGSNWTEIFEAVANVTTQTHREQFCLNGLIQLAVGDRVRCHVFAGFVFIDANRERNTFSGYLVG